MDQVVDFIKKEEPDIMALQEVRAEDAFPDFSYTHFAPEFYHHIDGGRFLTGNAVFSKYPITSSSYSHYFEPLGEGYEDRPQMYPVLPRNLQHVQLDVGGKLLNVFNTHGVWGQDGKDTERRLAVSEKIMAATEGKNSTVLCGDFNVSENTRTMLRLEDRFVNVFKNERTTSFNVRRKNPPGTYATTVVDFLFVTPDIKILSHVSLDIDISDHFPLIATLQID